MPLEVLPNLPQGHEAANALLFRFHALDPERSTIEVVPHPWPDPGQATERIFFSAVAVPRQGAFLTGGQHPEAAGESRSLSTAEAFLNDGERLAELAVRLTTGRSRHQSYFVDSGGIRSIFLVGGIPSADEKAAFAAVEEIPLP